MAVPTAVVSVSASGDTAIVAGVAGRRIRVLNVVLMAAGAVTVKFKSGAGTDLTGPLPLNNGQGLWPGWAAEFVGGAGHFETNPGEGLVLNLGASVAVGGWLNYLVVGH